MNQPATMPGWAFVLLIVILLSLFVVVGLLAESLRAEEHEELPVEWRDDGDG